MTLTIRRATISGIALLLLASSPGASHAQASATTPQRIRGLLRLALEHGGEKVGEFEYEDGSTPDVVAGSGGILAVGASAELLRLGTQGGLDVQGTLGLKYRTIPAATNQDLSWLRFPVEGLILFRSANGVRVGGGATVHLGNRISASGDVLNERVDFRNTPGVVFQAEYLRRNLGFDLRYTRIEYEMSEGGGTPTDASNIGVGLTFFFGRDRR